MARRMGAENKSREINMVIKKNRILIHLGTTDATLFNVFSSLENPISQRASPITACAVCVWEMKENEKNNEEL